MPTARAPVFLLDQMIKSGRIVEARRELKKLADRGVPKETEAEVAKLAWRAWLPQLGARLLNPIVRPGPRVKRLATDRERAIYAACLVQLGALDEAEHLLAGVADTPETLLFRVFALMAQWRYAEAIPILERYLAADIDDYARIVGRVNLAASLVEAAEHERAAELLAELRSQTEAEKVSRLHGNVLELEAINDIHARRWEDAQAALARADQFLQVTGAVDALFLRKWRAVLVFLRDGASPATRGALQVIRSEAARTKQWETLRNCDHVEAIEAKDDGLFWRVFAGTPYAGFRERLLAEAGRSDVPSEYAWAPGPEGSGVRIDLRSGSIEGRATILKPGFLPIRFLAALAADFYAPARAATLHARLYPGENYNPQSSPLRVRQALHRLRGWIESEKLPFSVIEDDHTYRLIAEGPAAIVVPLGDSATKREDWIALRLRRELGEKPFGAPEAAKVLDLTVRSVRRTLETLREAGHLQRLKPGTYVFPVKLAS